MNTLLENLEKSVYEKLCYLPNAIKLKVIKQTDVTIVNSNLATSMFNIVCNTNFSEGILNNKINEIINSFNEQPFAWWLGPSNKSLKLREELVKKGFIKESPEYILCNSLENLNHIHQSKSELKITRVNNFRELEDFASIIKPYDEKAGYFFDKLLNSNILNDNNYHFFIGYYNNIPVTIGTLFFNQDYAGAFDLITIPQYRGKGFAKDMVLYRLNFAKENNMKYFYLSASSEISANIYKKLGFDVLGNFDCYEWKGK
ncbi:MAG: GNAT family N-acetyltransferase [Sphingobacteriia bacterium]|nr:GNAT family N-acetyltransferase [Sphingobacteriia bacterium]